MSRWRAPVSWRAPWKALVHWQIPLVVFCWMFVVLYRADRTIPGDGAHLLIIEHRLADLLREGDFSRFGRIFAALVGPQPPLGYVPGILSDLLAPASLGGRLLVQGSLLLLAWDALYRLSRPVWPVLPWLLLVASPITWRAIDQYGRDLAAAVVVLQIVSHLRASQDLSDRRHAAWFGVWMGIGLLTKYTVPMYLLLPCLLQLPRLVSRERLGNLAVAVALFGVVAGPWLLLNHDMVATYIGRSSGETVSQYQRENLWDPEALALYPLSLKDAVGWPGILLVAAVAVLRRDARDATMLLLASALSGLLALSALPQAQDRFVLPAVTTFLAVTAALGAPWNTRLPVAERLLGGLGLGMAGVQLWCSAAAFAPGQGGPEADLTHPLSTTGDLAWPRSPTYRPAHFELSRWSLPGFFSALEAGNGGRRGTVGMALTNHPIAPGFAVLARAAQEGGYGWDYVTLHGGYGGGLDRFYGPLFDEGGEAWPSRDFSVFLAIRCPGDEVLGTWIERHAGEVLAEATLPNACKGQVSRYVAGDDRDLEGPLGAPPGRPDPPGGVPQAPPDGPGQPGGAPPIRSEGK